ncbi:hypothetical protein D3C71_1882490 [compost metagenome]
MICRHARDDGSIDEIAFLIQHFTAVNAEASGLGLLYNLLKAFNCSLLDHRPTKTVFDCWFSND